MLESIFVIVEEFMIVRRVDEVVIFLRNDVVGGHGTLGQFELLGILDMHCLLIFGFHIPSVLVSQAGGGFLIAKNLRASQTPDGAMVGCYDDLEVRDRRKSPEHIIETRMHEPRSCQRTVGSFIRRDLLQDRRITSGMSQHIDEVHDDGGQMIFSMRGNIFCNACSEISINNFDVLQFIAKFYLFSFKKHLQHLRLVFILRMFIVPAAPGVGEVLPELGREQTTEDGISCIRCSGWDDSEMIVPRYFEHILQLMFHQEPLIESHAVYDEVDDVTLAVIQMRQNPLLGYIRGEGRAIIFIISGEDGIDPALIISFEEFRELCVHFLLLIHQSFIESCFGMHVKLELP